jgi:alkylation response protein AidB-like acyl-CoA dehydrogenase
MSAPDRHNPYDFAPYLAWRESVDYYRDDPFVQALVCAAAGPRADAVDAAARALSQRASQRWRLLADASALPERRPQLVHWDAHHRRVDRIVRSHDSEALEREVFGEGLFSSRTDTPTRLAKMFLVYQNGEACTACPVVCTEGLVGLLERFADRAETRDMLTHLKEGRDGDFAIGAQFLTEIHGGSDVPANRVEAVEGPDGWRLHGTKFFCSVVHADYAVVTAKPQGSGHLAAFAMPMWDRGAFRERRNRYTIDRLKWKLGTGELPTAELTLDGALAYPVGALDRGLANVVGIVLTLSRLTVGLASGAYMTRAVREAEGYAAFREAFGRRLDTFPMVRGQLDAMRRAARRTTAAGFAIYRAFDEIGGVDGRRDGDLAARRRAFDVRELIMLQKFVAAEASTDVIRQAMSILGGNGVIEDFSCLPRLYRDSAVNELWEGPRNVLLAQIHRDLSRASSWYRASEFVRSVLSGGDAATADALAAEFDALVACPDLSAPGEHAVDVCERWERACRSLMRGYQDAALRAVDWSD